MSSVSPSYTRDLAEKVLQTGAGFIDTRSRNARPRPEQGTLVILAGGPVAEVRELQPLLLIMARFVLVG